MDNNQNKLAALSQLDSNINQDVQPISPASGWIDIDRSLISYGGSLYKNSLRFQVKPASIGTIKYFSTLDENNPLSVNDALTYVISNHIRVLDGSKSLPVLDIIYEHDRFFFVMLVHQYSGAPTSLSYEAQCTHEKCKHVQEVSIIPSNLCYSELTEKGQSYLNPATGLFVIPSKTLGTLTYRPLTLSESGELTEFMMSSRRKGDNIEKLFLQIAPFIVNNKKATDDASAIYQKYMTMSSDPKLVALMIHIIELINIQQLLQINVECKKCRKFFRSQISSVKGLRNIFLANDIADELS